MIRANTKHFTFEQLADLRDVFNGRCGEPNSTAVVNALKSNLGDQYVPSRATITDDGATFIGPGCTEDTLFMLIDELSAFMAQADITQPVLIEYDLLPQCVARLNETHGHVLVSGIEDARYSNSMIDRAMRAMKANVEISNARMLLQHYEYSEDEERGDLFILGTTAVYTLTYGNSNTWTVRLFNTAWDALDIRKVAAIREFPSLKDALEHLGEV